MYLMMPKHTVVFASHSSHIHCSAPFLIPTQPLELYLMGAQNLGPALHSNSRGLLTSFEPKERSTLKC